jgi:hypothetical protein
MSPEVAENVRANDAEAESVRLIRVLGRILLPKLSKLERMMAQDHATLEQVLAATQAQRSAIQSMATLLGGLRARINQALDGELSPAAQAKLDDALAEIQGNTRAITNAVLNNDDDPTNDVDNATGNPIGSGGAAAGSLKQLARTTTGILASKAVVTEGEAVSLSASVSSEVGGSITGTVTFASEAEALGKAGLDSTGVAALSVTDLPPGDHSITAVYSGDANYAASTSTPISQTVLPKPAPAETTTTADTAKDEAGGGVANAQQG